jgi:hypothetical protein
VDFAIVWVFHADEPNLFPVSKPHPMQVQKSLYSRNPRRDPTFKVNESASFIEGVPGVEHLTALPVERFKLIAGQESFLL